MLNCPKMCSADGEQHQIENRYLEMRTNTLHLSAEENADLASVLFLRSPSIR